jgi:hypothetical protein
MTKYILALALAFTSLTAVADEAFIRLNAAGDKGRVVILSTFAISSSVPTMYDLESQGLLDNIRGVKDGKADEAESTAFKEGRALTAN